MTDHELEHKIRTALEHAAPDQLDSILSSCDELQNDAEAPLLLKEERKKGDRIRMKEKKNIKFGKG